MSAPTGATGAVLELLDRLGDEEPQLAESFAAIRARLDGPLRVAIAGRVKAGKSTLLNALVGERLAPTDAGECTRLVSWYRKGPSYEVRAHLKAGGDRTLAFERTGGALAVQLGGLAEDQVGWLEVNWPSSALDRITLIDTPGLASINDENSRRTREFLDPGAEGGSDADAVIYLMRHVHKDDVGFLDAFMDRSVSAASPVNTVAVLSRSDEIGAGRPDAMESATRIARRYENDPQVRALCASVTPLAGLLAETGITLREDEVACLRTLAATDPAVLERMLLSVDEFCDVSASDLTVELRRDLLDRLGMFGVRIALGELAAGHTTASALGPRLVAHSGFDALRSIITGHFMPRARVLQARTALASLRALARSIRADDPRTANAIDREAERIESSAVEFAQLRAAHLVTSGTVRVNDAEREALGRLFLAPSHAEALGLGPSTADEALRDAALTAVTRWRNRAGDPLADPALIEVCETAARSCEAIYAHTLTANPS
jgi:GTPase SAR1 family protein